MVSSALRGLPDRMRRRPPQPRRNRRRPAPAGLVSVAGLVGVPVMHGAARVGRMSDLVVVWSRGTTYPPVVGIVVRAGRRHVWVPLDAVAELAADRVLLSSPLPGEAPQRRPQLVALAHDVLDRQVVDVDDVNVTRVSDLVVAPLAGELRLVGADVSLPTLVRRLGPARWQRSVRPERVYDWASVAAFAVRDAGEAGSTLRLTAAVGDLRALPPRDVAAVLADLPRTEREVLSTAVGGVGRERFS
jgi:hypothetical protein